MTNLRGVVVCASDFSEVRRLISLREKVGIYAKQLFKEIEGVTGRSLPDLVVCLHDRFSAQICAPLPHLPAWYSESVIHFLADVEWWKKDSKNLLSERHIASNGNAKETIKEYCEALDLEPLVYLLCGHEACHFLRLFGEDEKYYRVAPRWIEEGLCFYITYKLVERRRKRLSELMIETDRILFEALRQPLSERGHWLYEFYDFDIKYSRAGDELRNLIDAWDYSASTLVINELANASRRNLRELLDAISNSYRNVGEDLDRVRANIEFIEALFAELGIQEIDIDDFCLGFRICPV